MPDGSAAPVSPENPYVAKQPGNEHEWKCQRAHAPWFDGVSNSEHGDNRDGCAQHDIHPKKRSGGQKSCQREPYKDAIIAEEARGKRRIVGVKPLRGQGCHDHCDHPSDRHLRYTGFTRTPADRSQEKCPAQRIVLKHNLRHAAQIDVYEPQSF